MNNSPCEPLILIENQSDNYSICIVQCRHCQRIGLMFNNLLADFDLHEFLGFSAAYIRINFARQSLSMPPNTSKILVRSCHRDIHFCFTEPEFEIVKEALQQARLMLQAHEVLSRNSKG